MCRYRDLAADIESHEDEGRCIRQGIAHLGPQLVTALRDIGGFGATSVRQIAREADLSPTYVSHVGSGKCIASPDAFVRLARVLEKKRAGSEFMEGRR